MEGTGVAKKVAKNALYRTIATLIGSFSGLFLAIVLARVLKPKQFGIYSLATSIAMICIALSNSGVNRAIIRYVAYYHGKNNFEKIRYHFKYFLKIEIFLALTISATLVLFSERIAMIFNNTALETPLKISGAIVFFASLLNALNAFFSGLQEFKYVLIKQLIYEISRWILIVPLSYLFLANGALGGTALANFVTFMILIFIISIKFKYLLFGNSGKVDEKVLQFVGFTTIASISGVIYICIDSIMVGYLLNTTDVGYYRAGYSIVFAVASFITMADVFLPVFTQLEGSNLSNAINKLAKYTSTMSFPAAFGLAFLSRYIIKIVYGKEYLTAAQVMAILSLILIPASFNYLSTVFSAKEQPKYSAYVITASMVLNIILNYLLINWIGINGAALATVVSRFFNIILFMYLLYRVFDLKVSVKVLLKPLFCSTVMLAILIALPTPASLISGLFEVVFAISIYFILLFIIRGITLDDIRYIRCIINI